MSDSAAGANRTHARRRHARHWTDEEAVAAFERTSNFLRKRSFSEVNVRRHPRRPLSPSSEPHRAQKAVTIRNGRQRRPVPVLRQPQRRPRSQSDVTYANLMSSYPSARPSLAQLLDLIPPIKPRYYSIASSPHVVPGELELSVVILVDGPHWVPVALKPGVGICMPPHPSTPIVMAGLGTGLAPMRAMVQERWWQVVHGKRVGPSVLFFGCRHSKGDYLYSSKWDEYVQQGALYHLRVAFSRDGPKKVYIQDKIAAEPELLYDCFVKSGGYFFFCGPAGRVPQDIRAAIETAMSEAGKEEGFTKEMASQYIDKMRLQGRYIIEAWS
eukprot:tig00001095_g7035.t1